VAVAVGKALPPRLTTPVASGEHKPQPVTAQKKPIAPRQPQLGENDTDSEADISDNEDEAITGQSATVAALTPDVFN